jgi:hypothetical protein
MGWLQGEIFRCTNPECECELTLTRAAKRGWGGIILPTCCCCGNLMALVKPGM